MHCPPGGGFPVELAVTIDDGTAFVFASHDPTRTAAAEPTGRAAFRTFLAGIRLQRSELNWRPGHARPAASPARGRQPTAAESARPAQPPAIQTDLCADNRTIYPVGADKYSADLIPYQNSGKDCAAIVDKVERTVSEYAGRFIDIRAGNALISA